MKKVFLLLMVLCASLLTHAQGFANYADSMLSRWCIDVNGRGGLLSQNYTSLYTLDNYAQNINSNTGTLKFKNGYNVGGELQVGYFFGRMRHWGVGTGINYTSMVGDITVDGYHVEYRAVDFKDNVYRQVLTANNVAEHMEMTGFNIPVLLKYKNRWSKHWGFTADGGLMLGVQRSNSWKADASFNYEAIYKFTDLTHTVYDDAPVANVEDYFITRANWLKNNHNGDVQAYFNDLNNKGYNVGLNVKPGSGSGKTTFSSVTLGILLKPSVNLFLSDNVALDFGVYYMFQPFKGGADRGYTLTSKVGDYNTVLNSVSTANTQSYGVNIGARFFLGRRPKDRDHDGVPDKKDLCPDDSGSVLLQGCLDRDGDGITDKNDSCPDVKGLVKFNGCPDSDKDGIEDRKDECPFDAGLKQFNGCPDRDKDGVIDKNDACPDVPGEVQYRGCPDSDADGIPDPEDHCPTVPGPVSNFGCPEGSGTHGSNVDSLKDVDPSTPILFDINKTSIKKESMPVLEKAARLMKEGKDITINIGGFTDNTGPEDYNQGLSIMRGMAVKLELVRMGVKFEAVKVTGYGEKKPAAPNNTPEGRRKNRRAVMNVGK
ncbi:hypothetical protein CJD36_014755 [Flavipsychrobacter stenotrophus]|uniref:OmpA-like domain-containing protein n=1 Tax=Flavipsychrobacter stenotrophus TaxID=2077091 RepID=A0A2S7STC8_9BACT|nr:OmpA family protein [Flavipsychrobacter stenotrophus]PQJ09958.1 hypothetical protein CJD36_014755 [Flavipsychrobacter stenotrophus]